MPVYRQFLRYTIPTVAAMLVNGLYQVVDGIFIGHYMGADGLAGINLAWPVIAMALGLGMLLGVGSGALSSIKQGEGDQDGAKRILATGLITLVCVAPVIATIIYFGAPYFLSWQGADEGGLLLARQYLDILTVGCVFTLGSIATPFLLRNDNSPNLATILMIAGAVTNIVFDYLFIAVLGWQLRGAALATLLAQMVVTLAGGHYFFSSRATLRLTRQCLRMEWQYLPRIILIGLSSFFMYIYSATTVALHNSQLAHYGESVSIGAYAILGYIITVYYLTVEGIANGMQPLASFYYGAKNYPVIRTLLRLSMSVVVLGGIAFVVGVNLFATSIIQIFNSDDQALRSSAEAAIRLHLFALFFDGFLVVTGAYFQALGYSRSAMFITLGNITVQMPFLFLLPLWFGLDGVWLAFPLSNIALSTIAVVMLWRELQRNKPINRAIFPTGYRQ